MAANDLVKLRKTLKKQASKYSTRFCLLFLVFTVVQIVAGIMFHYIEDCMDDKKNNMHNRTNTTNNTTSREECFSNLGRVFIWNEYAFSISTTIGYGRVVTTTDLGKILTIFYAFITIPFAITTFTLCSRALENLIQLIVIIFENRILTRDCIKRLKVKTICLQIFILLLVISIFGYVYHVGKVIKDYRLLNTIYLAFITVSTIGFGDFNYNEEEMAKKDPTIKILTPLVQLVCLIIGLSLFNTIVSVISDKEIDFSLRLRCRSCRTSKTRDKNSRLTLKDM